MRTKNRDKIDRLKSYNDICNRIDLLKEVYDRIQNTMQSPKCMIITDMPRGGGGKSDMMLMSFEKLEKLEQDIQNEQDKLIPLLDDIRNIIESIEIVRHYEVMTWRYIVGLTWEEVAERMGYDIRHVTRLHGQALNRLT